MSAIYWREMKSYFFTMSGYVFVASFLCATGLLFTINNLFMLSDSFSNIMLSNCYLMILTVPALTMRLFAEERWAKTDQILLCAPVKVSSIVMGKYLSGLSVLALSLVLSLYFPVLLVLLGNPRASEIFLGYLGCFLLGASLISVGMFVSSITINSLSAAVTTSVTLLFLYIAYSVGSNMAIPQLRDALGFISPYSYLSLFRIGILSMKSVVALLSYAAVFIWMTILSIDFRMWR